MEPNDHPRGSGGQRNTPPPRKGSTFRLTREGPIYTIAPYSRRLTSGILDHAIPLLVWLMSAYAATFIFFIATLAYVGFIGWNIWTEGLTGQTLGKKFAQTSLVTEADAQPLGPGKNAVRWIAHVLDSAPIFIGFLLPVWDVKRQTFADKLMRTVVIEEKY